MFPAVLFAICILDEAEYIIMLFAPSIAATQTSRQCRITECKGHTVAHSSVMSRLFNKYVLIGYWKYTTLI